MLIANFKRLGIYSEEEYTEEDTENTEFEPPIQDINMISDAIKDGREMAIKHPPEIQEIADRIIAQAKNNSEAVELIKEESKKLEVAS